MSDPNPVLGPKPQIAQAFEHQASPNPPKRLKIDRDMDVITHHDAAVFQSRVPAQPGGRR